jgi:hypothetical protein
LTRLREIDSSDDDTPTGLALVVDPTGGCSPPAGTDAQVEGLLSMNWLRELGHHAVNDFKFGSERLVERRRRFRRRWDHSWGPVRMIDDGYYSAEVVVFPCTPDATDQTHQAAKG